MLEKPVLDEPGVLARVQQHYRLYGLRLRFLSPGNDPRSAAYRLDVAGREPYYVKLRRGTFNPSTLEVPRALQLEGGHVIAPVPTYRGRLSIPFGNSRIALYPFVDGTDGFVAPLTAPQWKQLGETVAAVHALRVPGLGRVPIEAYSAHWRRKARGVLRAAQSAPSDDPLARQMAELLVAQSGTVERLIDAAEHIAASLRREARPFVFTHGDLHAGNVLVGGSGELFVVDWDTLTRAPIERDLMFVGGGIGGVWNRDDERAWFYEGYGVRHVDQAAIQYYRCERIVQDVVVYAGEVFRTAGDPLERARGLDRLTNQFKPGNVADIALDD